MALGEAGAIHARVGKADDAHARGDGRRDAERRVLHDDAARWIHAERLGRRQENVRRRFAAAHAWVVAAHDRREDRKPLAMAGSLDAEQTEVGAGRDGEGDTAPVELAGEHLGAGNGTGRREELFEHGGALPQVILGPDRQAHLFDEVFGRVHRGPPEHVGLHRPVEHFAVTRGDAVGDFGVDGLGVEQHAIHVEDDVLGRRMELHGIAFEDDAFGKGRYVL
jgi:hypothetical protein